VSVYEASHVKRVRRTKAQLADLDAAIIAAVAEDAPVSLRGVYYRVVSAGAVEKTDKGYQLVGHELLKLRRSGQVPYNAIADGTRTTYQAKGCWTDLDEMLADASASYRRQLWHDQDSEVHIFSEKDAMSGVVWPVCNKWNVPLGIVRGYASETFAWSTAQTIEHAMIKGKYVFVYQLGDHDPSGVDAWRSFEERVRGFLDADGYDDHIWQVEFERLAVTPAQIADLELPTRPTKGSDTRSAGFAGESVEVDAIRAPVLRQIVEDAITQHIDPEVLRITRETEKSERDILTKMIGRR
jgi:hypothetical protein